MTPIRRPGTLRRIATAMLLLWVLALGASWANACLLQDRQTHVHSGAADGDGALGTVTAGHGGAVPSHGDDAGAGELACQDVCDAASQTCTQKEATPAAIDLADLPPPLRLAASRRVVTRLPKAAFAVGSPPPAAVPLRARLSRLTL